MTRIVIIGTIKNAKQLVTELSNDRQSSTKLTSIIEPAANGLHRSARQSLNEQSCGDTSWENSNRSNPYRTVFASVMSIDRKDQQIKLSTGQRIVYDKLILAHHKNTEFDELNLPRNITELLARLRASKPEMLPHGVTGNVAVIGGGLKGIECAMKAIEQGLKAEIFESQSYVLPDEVNHRILSATASRELQVSLQRQGVVVHTDTTVSKITLAQCNKNTQQPNCTIPRATLWFSNGTSMQFDAVLTAAAGHFKTPFQFEPGVTISETGYATRDDHSLVDDSNIYAVGECAMRQSAISRDKTKHFDDIHNLVQSLLGNQSSPISQIQTMRLCFPSVDFALARKNTQLCSSNLGTNSIEIKNAISKTYKELVYDAHNLLHSGVILGNPHAVGLMFQLIEAAAINPNPNDVIFGRQINLHAKEISLEATDKICVCNGVTVGEIERALKENLTASANTTDNDVSFKDEATKHVIRQTRAATGCGSCLDQVKTTIDTLFDVHELAQDLDSGLLTRTTTHA